MTKDELLDRLIGTWDLRGRMGSSDLHQAVSARWVLAGRYVELRFVELDGTQYEAVYHLGRNDDEGVYVLHLLDSTGVYVNANETVATGRRVGDAIAFVFGDDASFTNVFEWHADEEAWTFELSSFRDGAVEIFATKRMMRL
jgi:hypothetical protein